MGLLGRIWNVIRGKAHKTVSGLENPAEQLSVFIEDLNKTFKSQQQAVIQAVADEKKLKMQIDDVFRQCAEWDKRAMLALQSNDEGLAKQALEKKHELEEKAAVFEVSWRSQFQATEKLKASLAKSKQQSEEAKRKYTLLAAQYQAAKAQRDMSKQLSSLESASPGAMIDSLQDKIQQMEAETAATLSFESSNDSGDLEGKFRQLETNRKTENSLEELKRRLATGDSSARDVTDSDKKLKSSR